MSNQTTRPGLRLVRRTSAAAVVLTLALGLAACGSDDNGNDRADDSINRSDAEPSSDTTSGGSSAGSTDRATEESTDAAAPVVERREPTPNVVRVDGGTDTLTTPARAAFARSSSGITVTQEGQGESRGFARLCIGDVDVVDSERPITPAEYEQCRANGLDIVQFQVGADAVVLAIRSQTDVGTDCLSTDQVRAAFRSGSEITNWSQLGDNLESVKFEAGGPTVDFNAARFFGRYVLQNPEPVNSDFRVDYAAAADETATLKFVTGSEEERRQARDLTFIRPVYEQLKALLKKEWADWARANNEVKVATAEQRKGVADKWTPAERAATDVRVTKAYAERGREITEVNSAKAKLKPYDDQYQYLTRLQTRIDDEYGHVGLFSQGFYATYEDRLRPFEIEVYDGDSQPNCIFPSPQTIINGQYPLSRPLLLTTTTRSLQRPEVREFLTSYLDNSDTYAEDIGVVALPNVDRNRQLAWLEEDATLPKFAVVDDQVREITEEEEEQASDEQEPAPPVQNPAR